MYHCKTKFYLTGNEDYFSIIKSISPLENFTHEFIDDPCAADVIIADINGKPDGGSRLQSLVSGKKPGAEIIVLAESTDDIGVPLNELTDVWITPMSESAFVFRFSKWQQRLKNDKDRWQSEQYLDTLIDNMPSMVWFKSRDGIHEKVNVDFCKTVGKTREDIVGKRHAYIWSVPEDDPACIESDNKAMETETTVISEEHVAMENGTRELKSYKSPLYDLDGSVMGTVGLAIDITKERAFENEVITKNKTLEHMFASVDCGMMWHSCNGRDIYYINDTALKILDYKSVDELMDNGFNYIAQSVLDEDKEMLSDQIKSLQDIGDSVNVEYRVKHKDGKILHIMGNIKLIQEDGRTFYQRYLLDVTEQKKESFEKEHRREELVQVLAANYSVVCYFDLNTRHGNALHINECPKKRLKKLFGGRLEIESTIAAYCNSCVAEEDRELVKANCAVEKLKKELSEKGSHFINYRVSCDKEEKYFQIKAVKVGSDIDCFGIVLGIRSVDEEIREEMENRAILENALQQANRANKAKSVFLSNMSHDIRTPMNAIVGFTTLALTHIDNKEHVEGYLRKIISSGNHLLSLINDVLDMSRIESGKMHLDEKPCTLPDILHGLCNMIRPDVQKKQMDFRMDTANVHNEDIMCDKLRLNQVLLNLLSNAVKYTQPGGRISFRTTETKSPNKGCSYYEFAVSDNGMGMNEEFVKHIFEPFERERNTTASGIQGTGLGMAITKNIVDMMHGTIDVQSSPGEGTKVTVRVELKVLERSKAEKELINYRNQRALVVDDDFNTCDSVSYMLGQLGLHAEWTLSGKEAVLRSHQAVMRNTNYSVYIVDWLLPDMNGVEVTRRIRKETGGNVPIIVLTAYDWSDIETEAMEAGVTAFCNKPLFLSELSSCLQSVLRPNSPEDDTVEKEISPRHTGRILLAEDVEMNQELAVELLQSAGFSVDVAENGQIAFDLVAKSEPGYYQAVLMDVQMPVMDGYEATKQIRKLENHKLASIPIIAMTANAFTEDREEALKIGMNGHIAKPIDVQVLFQTLDNVL